MSPRSSRLRASFESAGARWIEVSVLHPAEPFLETAGEDIRRRMFVTEGPAGERLALRPDFTIPVCLEHLRSGAGPARYAYAGTVFRRHDSGSPERPETGFEDIGRDDQANADAETLALAVAAVSAIASGRLTVRLGDIGLFAALLQALDLPPPWQRKLRRAFGVPAPMEANLARLSAPRGAEDSRLDADIRAAADRHDGERLAALLDKRRVAHGHAEGVGRSPEDIAERFIDQRALSDARINAGALATLRGFLALEASLAEADQALRKFCSARGVDLGNALSLFAERSAAIASLRPSAEIRFEAGFGRPLDYYTGLVFDVRAAGIAFPVAGGGRYDRLMQMLGAGQPIPAVGFTMRLDLAGDEAR
jgi:ATP phosphoribosyltransferase regulatory subunit